MALGPRGGTETSATTGVMLQPLPTWAADQQEARMHRTAYNIRIYIYIYTYTQIYTYIYIYAYIYIYIASFIILYDMLARGDIC